MTAFVELFTSPTCPFCPATKQTAVKVVKELVAKGEQVELYELNVRTPQGSAKADEYGITHVPTLVVYAENGIGKKILLDRQPSEKDLTRAIAIANGTESVPVKKPLLSRLTSWLKH